MKHLIIIITFLFILFSCKNDKKENDILEESNSISEEQVKKPKVKTGITNQLTIQLEQKSNSGATGVVAFSENDGVVSMLAKIDNLSPGEHAIHLHEKADCSAEDGSSAGGHWNPTAQQHGEWGDAKGFHLGDIGNFTADENGKAIVNFTTDKWCIDCGDPKRDIIGKSIIVHQGFDDFVSQPSGNAGGRVSCGGIIQ